MCKLCKVDKTIEDKVIYYQQLLGLSFISIEDPNYGSITFTHPVRIVGLSVHTSNSTIPISSLTGPTYLISTGCIKKTLKITFNDFGNSSIEIDMPIEIAIKGKEVKYKTELSGDQYLLLGTLKDVYSV
jgi:hypothetical protein